MRYNRSQGSRRILLFRSPRPKQQVVLASQRSQEDADTNMHIEVLDPEVDCLVPTEMMSFRALPASSEVFEVWNTIETDLMNDLCQSEEVGCDILAGPVSISRSNHEPTQGIIVLVSGSRDVAHGIASKYGHRVPEQIEILVREATCTETASGSLPQWNQHPRASLRNRPLHGHWQRYPKMGASISPGSGKGSGTLGCYVTDEGRTMTYAITNAHVLENENDTTPLPRKTPPQDVVSPSNQDRTILLYDLIKLKIEAQTMFKSRFARYLTSSEGDKVRRGTLKEAVLVAERNVREFKKGDSVFGKVVDGFRGIVEGSWIDIAVVKPAEGIFFSKTLPRPFANPCLDREGNNEITGLATADLRIAGWGVPHGGSKVIKVGRTSGITQGEILGIFTKCRIPDPGNRANRLITHEWAVTTDEEYIKMDNNGHRLHFMDRGDSGSVLVGRDTANNASPVMGLLFAAFMGQRVADIACFTPSDKVARALRSLTGQYLMPCHPEVPASDNKEVVTGELELKHHCRSSEAATAPAEEDEPEGQPMGEVLDPPDMDFTAPIYNMYVDM